MKRNVTLGDDAQEALQEWGEECVGLVEACEARDDALDSLIETQESILAELKQMRNGRKDP